MSSLGLFGINQSPSNSVCNNELTWAAKKTASFHSFPQNVTFVSLLCFLLSLPSPARSAASLALRLCSQLNPISVLQTDPYLKA